jgi:hypoxanthine-DNA glycosylase
MQRLFAGGTELDYPECVEMLQWSRVAVWDVLRSADRSGSLDSAIVTATAVPNDIAGFLREYPAVRSIFFNGATAERLFLKHIGPAFSDSTGVRLEQLPSTSPANARISFEKKLVAWRAVASAAGG